MGSDVRINGELLTLRSAEVDAATGDALERVIVRRGSTRRFSRESITLPQLSTILAASACGLNADFHEHDASRLNDVFIIVNAVDGLPQGSYAYHPDEDGLELIEAGDFRSQAGHLGLSQELPADASVNIYFLSDLKSVLGNYGNRGYRAAQLDASIRAGRIYLASYAQRIGATGLTFFDDGVTEFFSPLAEGRSVMFLIAVGRRDRSHLVG